MKLLTYSFKEIWPSKWEISNFNLKDINLIAGVSGVGKTRLLNTIHNLSLMLTKRRELSPGSWDILLDIDRKEYQYLLEINRDKDNKNFISKEILIFNKEKIIDRTRETFKFNKNLLPKLGDTDIGIYLLRNENKIQEVYESFKKIYIRRNNPEFGIRPDQEVGVGILSRELLEKNAPTIREIQENYWQLNVQFFLLEKYYPEIFKQIINDFKQIFPFVNNVYIRMYTPEKNKEASGLPFNSVLPMFLIKEKEVDTEIPLFSLSSGMIRALIQLIDIYTIPKGSIYLIDEIENSMGITSLSVMIDILFANKGDIQYIFTTHHPYIFNNVDIKYWQILKRKGDIIKIYSGDELNKKFSKSYQEKYIQLINSDLIEQGI
ncbi:MAG: ATP-binding protein [Candidatus Thermoplasmatota archaeon]|nr:ATP-binding protein [Candidatus Thermoplasmatota archaeon]